MSIFDYFDDSDTSSTGGCDDSFGDRIAEIDNAGDADHLRTSSDESSHDLVHDGYDPAAADSVIGEPEVDVRFWQEQISPTTCAVAAQQEVLAHETGLSFSQARLAGEAARHGWLEPIEGTPLSHVGDLLDAHGVHTFRGNGDIAELTSLVARDVPVIVPVDSSVMWGSGDSSLDSASVMLGGSADHVVVVTGLDHSDPAHPMVVVNDSGRPDGAGLRVEAGIFERAWAESGHFLVYPDGAEPSVRYEFGAESDLAEHFSTESGEPVVGTALPVEGQTDQGDDVYYSTTDNEYHNQRTDEPVVPK